MARVPTPGRLLQVRTTHLLLLCPRGRRRARVLAHERIVVNTHPGEVRALPKGLLIQGREGGVLVLLPEPVVPRVDDLQGFVLAPFSSGLGGVNKASKEIRGAVWRGGIVETPPPPPPCGAAWLAARQPGAPPLTACVFRSMDRKP